MYRCRRYLVLFLLPCACATNSLENPSEKVGSLSAEIVVETPSWTTHPSDLSDARFGESLSGSLDINGDGFDDVLVTAPLWDGEADNEGRVYAYMGSERGLPTTPSWFSDPTNVSNSGFGPVAALGDIDADGFGDFAVLAADIGILYIYMGTATGPNDTPMQRASNGAQTIAAAGDVNGDGFADLITGSPNYSAQQSREGQARIILGAADGLTGTEYSMNPTGQADAFFGSAVACAGDLNGDGFADVAIGAPGWDGQALDQGRVYVYFGSSAAPTSEWILEPSSTAGAGFGSALSGAGDVNGDGLADLLVGAPRWSDAVEGRGSAYLYYGTSGAQGAPVRLSPIDQVDANFGFSVAGVGDVDGDGFSDIAVGSIGYDANAQALDSGEMLLFLGGRTGVDPEIGGTSAPGVTASAHYGFAVSTAGDVNGDGLTDIICSAPLADGGIANEGVSFGFYGVSPLEVRDSLLLRDRELQQSSEGATLVGGSVITSTSVTLSAKLVQERPIGGRLSMDFELKLQGVPFDGRDIVQSSLGATGSTATVSYSDLIAGAYHWRVRTLYPVGTGRSGWTTFETPTEGGGLGDNGLATAAFTIEEAEVIVPPPPAKIGYYDCQIAPAPAQGPRSMWFLLLLAPMLALLRSNRPRHGGFYQKNTEKLPNKA